MSELIQNFIRDFPNYKIIDVCAQEAWAGENFKLVYFLKIAAKAITKPNNIYVIETNKISKSVVDSYLNLISSVRRGPLLLEPPKYFFFNKDYDGYNAHYNKLFIHKSINENDCCSICNHTYNDNDQEINKKGAMCEKCFTSICMGCSMKIIKENSKCPFCRNDYKVLKIAIN